MNRFSFLVMSALYAYTYSLPAGHAPLPPTLILTPFNNLTEITNQKVAQAINAKAFTIIPPFPDSGRKHAVLEQESLVSKADTAYSNLQQFVASFYNPKPVVDTIQEHEKYGNDGSFNRKKAVAFIGAVEGVSNVLNAAADVPFETARQVVRKITGSLTSVGAKVSGL